MPARKFLFASLPQNVALLLVLAGPAHAAVDVSGRWFLTFPGSAGQTTFEMTQAGTALTATLGLGGVGTIDPDSGAFLLTGTLELAPGIPEGPPVVICDYALAATAAPDGYTFTGSFSSPCGPTLPAAGTRCGNGVLDPGEACDAALPCCSTSCEPANAGSPCPNDGNVCTDDVCDGATNCLHPANTASCGDTCAPGTCAGGACVPGTPAAAGTSCDYDLDLCTVSTCDGAGQCLTAARECGPCEQCFTFSGCVAHPRSDCVPTAGHSTLDIRKGSSTDRDTIRWSRTDDELSVPGLGLGNPLASTSYQLCVYPTVLPYVSFVVAHGEVSSGGTCDGSPCWSSTPRGFRYRNRSPAGGVKALTTELRPVSRPTFRLLSKGLPASLPLSGARVQLVATDGNQVVCWESGYVMPSVSSPTRFRARR
jgi:hypothetical protein